MLYVRRETVRVLNNGHIARHRTVLLLGITFFVLLFAYVFTTLSKDIKNRLTYNVENYTPQPNVHRVPSTLSWKTFEHEPSGAVIKYPPTWQTNTKSIDGIDQLTFTPENISTTDRVRIYVTKDGYFGLEGLPQKTTIVEGNPSAVIDNGLQGVEHNKTYYTFEAGHSNVSIDTMQAMLGTLQFTK